MGRTIAIMQPYLFPYIGYFQLINAVDCFIILDSVTFIKSGWINRNRILINDEPIMFNFNCKNISSNRLIKDILINKESKSLNTFRKTLEYNYKKAPYYPIVEELCSHIYEQIENDIFLVDFILRSMQIINEYLGITTTIIPTSSQYNNELCGQARIINICKMERADCYINPIGGTELYNKQIFAENNIDLKFLKSREIRYKQFSNEFVPWLSIIDVMMFNSVDQIRSILAEYDLV